MILIAGRLMLIEARTNLSSGRCTRKVYVIFGRQLQRSARWHLCESKIFVTQSARLAVLQTGGLCYNQ